MSFFAFLPYATPDVGIHLFYLLLSPCILTYCKLDWCVLMCLCIQSYRSARQSVRFKKYILAQPCMLSASAVYYT